MKVRCRIALILSVLAITMQATYTLYSDSGKVDYAAQQLLDMAIEGVE
jgi:hypothetical protein